MPLSVTLSKVVCSIFSKYDLDEDAMSFVNEGSTRAADASEAHGSNTVESMQGETVYGYGSERDQEFENVSMSSEYSSDDVPKNRLKVIRFENSDSEETMSIPSDPDNDYDEDDDETHRAEQRRLLARAVTKWTAGDLVREITAGGEPGLQSTTSLKRKCTRCEAYDAHCKSAADNYRRVLTSYTKTVSELMIGFKQVLERYPELRVDTSDDRLNYMVQAALGRNNLVREMVRLAAKRQMRETVKMEPGRGECDEATIVSVGEALNACYTESEAIRLLLQRYTNLYVRYIQVWREMCSKVSRDITVMEFINLTQDRPGVSHGEPWSEAKAYVARMLDKVGSITPVAVGEACTSALKKIDCNLSSAPVDFEKHKEVVDSVIEDIRSCLDSGSQKWSWDSCMNDLYFDIRSDLTVLEALVGVGEISVKTLLYERSMLVSQVRNMTRNEGSLKLQVAQTRSKLRDSVSRSRYAAMNAL